jgi:lambda family phage portal protein
MAWRKSLVSSIARILGVRGYNGAKQSGHVWGGSRVNASANVNDDLDADRYELRRRSRHAWQNSASARAIVEADVALVVSTGIDIEPDTGSDQSDERIREAWAQWTEHASACGTMDLWTLQRQARRSERTAGEFLWALVDTDNYDRRGIPRAIMPLESDRLSMAPVASLAAGSTFVSGKEIDRYGRVIAYHISDGDGDAGISSPKGGTLVAGSGGTLAGSLSSSSQRTGRRYLAAEIIHGYESQRPGQMRGEPGLAPVLNTLRQEMDLVEAELTAAKVGAAHSIKIKTVSGMPPSGDPSIGTDGVVNTYDFSPGSINMLAPGEDAEVMANPRPSQQISPFRQMLRGDMAGATGIPQRYIDRDTSRANYSSMRADMLDTKRIMDPQQQRFGRQAASEVYLRILPQLATAAGVSLPPVGSPERARFERHKVMPDGWAYVDPQKDIAAGIDGIRAGLSTWQDELQARGKDPRRVLAQLQKELADPLLAGIFNPAPPAAPAAESEDDEEDDTEDEPATAPPTPDPERESIMHQRQMELARASVQPAPVVHVGSPIVNVAPAAVTVQPAEVRVDIPPQPAPIVNVTAPAVTVEAARQEPAQITVNVPQQAAPAVNVNVSPTPVTIDNTVEVPARTVIARPNKDGSVTMTPQE